MKTRARIAKLGKKDTFSDNFKEVGKVFDVVSEKEDARFYIKLPDRPKVCCCKYGCELLGPGGRWDLYEVPESREEYIKMQARCGISVGDTVRVVRPADDHEGGWKNVWAEDMDETVGKEIVITRIDSDGLGIGSQSFLYPYFCLEKVASAATAPESIAKSCKNCIFYKAIEDREYRYYCKRFDVRYKFFSPCSKWAEVKEPSCPYKDSPLPPLPSLRELIETFPKRKETKMKMNKLLTALRTNMLLSFLVVNGWLAYKLLPMMHPWVVRGANAIPGEDIGPVECWVCFISGSIILVLAVYGIKIALTVLWRLVFGR